MIYYKQIAERSGGKNSLLIFKNWQTYLKHINKAPRRIDMFKTEALGISLLSTIM